MSKTDYREIQREITTINEGVSLAFKKVGEEFSEHLDTINANTSEISALTQALNMLEQKVDKLNERIDELTMKDSVEISCTQVPEKEFNLSIKEQEVFLTLYTSENFISPSSIARSVGRTSDNVNIILSRLNQKEIPLMRKVADSGEIVYALDKNFKQLQAKNNIVRLHENVLNEMTC